MSLRAFQDAYVTIRGRGRLNKIIKRIIDVFGSEGKDIVCRIMRGFYATYGRYDGRKFDQIRDLSLTPNILKGPLTSALVIRGKTKVLASLTSSDQPQSVEEVFTDKAREYTNVQYDMLDASVGEAGRTGLYSRREVGHGHLIYGAIKHLRQNNHYSIFIQNDVISCAGSSSMAGVIGSSLTSYLANS
ncbi:MAG: hypothetical protein GY771_06455, partial [bacterium]|nr:hypothetical protein [bacterium]